MVVIFSDKDDYSTNKVIEYLKYWKEKFIRINKEDGPNTDFNIVFSNRCLSLEIWSGSIQIDIDDIKSIWFRRGGFYLKEVEKTDILNDSEVLMPQLQRYLLSEQSTLNTLIYEILISKRIRILGNPFLLNTKKLSVLRRASLCGLDIPETIVTTRRINLEGFIKKKDTITKAIQDNFTPKTNRFGYGLLTEFISSDIVPELPEVFFPSLFQELINKEFDVRIFYLDGEFWSIAIFSQEMENTAVDFRNYDYENPNRMSKIILPSEIRRKLKKLLNDLNLNTASIDMIYTIEKRFVFLEINPVGQYDMVGKLMNFQLDRKIARWLVRN